MTKTAELAFKLSENRQRINELLMQAVSETRDTELKKLQEGMPALEKEYREALTAEGKQTTTVDSQEKERRELRNRSNFGRILQAFADKRQPDGAEGELLADRTPGTIPIDLLDAAPREHRAATTPPNLGAADDQPVVQNLLPTVPFLFVASAAGRLGIAPRSMGAGQMALPSFSSAPTAGKVAKGTAVTESSATYGTVLTRQPERGVVAQVVTSVEDRALWPVLASDLGNITQGALSDALDAYVFSTATNDLFTQATDVAAETDVLVWSAGIKMVAELLDGDKHAMAWSDLRLLIGKATFAKMASLFNQTDMSLYDYLRARLGAVVISSRAPAVASSAQKALIILSGGGAMPFLPEWGGLQVTVDPYTDAGKGETKITYTMLTADPVVPYGTEQLKELHPKLS